MISLITELIDELALNQTDADGHHSRMMLTPSQ